MDRFAGADRAAYHLFDYDGAPDADRVVVMMGSGVGNGQRHGRRPERTRRTGRRAAGPAVPAFAADAFLAALPPGSSVAVLEQTKESGAPGEPLYLDVADP